MARRKKDINIRLVAEQAGVSLATVSRVINNRTDVSESVRNKVLEVVDSLNFAPTKSSERRINIGVIVVLEQSMLNEYSTEVLDGIANSTGGGNVDVTVIFYRLSDSAKSLLQLIRERRCDAVMVFPFEKVADQLDDLENAGIPTMIINGDRVGAKLGYINNESYSGAREMMQYLLGMGHRKIGFLCNSLVNSINHQQRLQAYLDAMTAAKIDIIDGWVISHTPTALTEEAGYNQCKALLTHPVRPTAIFCTNDEMALGAIKCCWDNNLKVPDDISVVGFDDIRFTRFIHPALTTVRQPLREIGDRAIRALDEFLKGQLPALPAETLHTTLVIRDSVKNLKEKSI